jgi:DHA3 family macrolide efflux protein-like MFS transporter
LYVLDLTGSAFMFSTVLGLSILPGVLVNIFAGVLVDKANKKKLLIMCDISGAVIMGLFLLAFNYVSSSIGLIIIISVLLSILQNLFSLTLNASIPNLVEKDDVTKLNSSYQGLGALLNILGPIIGALLYKAVGLGWIIGIEVIAFLIAAFLQVFMVFRSNDIEAEPKSYKESLKEVYTFLNNRKVIKLLLFFVVIINFILTPFIVIVLPYIAYEALKLSANQLALIQAVWSIGFIIGAAVISIKAVNKVMINKIFILLQIQAVLFFFWIFPQLSLIPIDHKNQITLVFCIILGLQGLFNAATNIPMLSYMQIFLPDNLRAGVLGVVNTAVQIAVPLGIWLYGICIELQEWSYLIVASSILLLIIGIVANRIRDLKHFFSS